MRLQRIHIITIFISVFIILPSGLFSGTKLNLNIETGPVFSSYNSVQVPQPEGTRFSLTDDLDVKGKLYYRLRLTYDIGKLHQISVLYAPLTLKAEGIAEADLRFQDSIFSSGEKLSGSYTFNSYRLTYRYKLVRKPKLDLWIGFTAKIRDAEISIESETKRDNTENVGFVPLLNLIIHWKWSDKTGLIFEADALASPGGEGRAEDVALGIYVRLSPKSRIKAGYRFVEGGADVESVYNFAFLHYFFIGYQIGL